jgi:hypothetical protein
VSVLSPDRFAAGANRMGMKYGTFVWDSLFGMAIRHLSSDTVHGHAMTSVVSLAHEGLRDRHSPSSALVISVQPRT